MVNLKAGYVISWYMVRWHHIVAYVALPFREALKKYSDIQISLHRFINITLSIIHYSLIQSKWEWQKAMIYRPGTLNARVGISK